MRNKKLSNNALVIALSAILLGLIFGSLMILFMGDNPITAYYYLFRGGLMSFERIGNTLATSTALMLVGLSVAFAFKTGLFNIGGAGQMLMGGFMATIFALNTNIARPINLILLILIGSLSGAIWGLIPGLLKARFNVHEVVSTIMMNWIAYSIVFEMVPAFLKAEYLETESRAIPVVNSLRASWIKALTNSDYLNYGLFIALIAAIIIKIILDKTTLGYELKAVGFNKDCAEYAGIKVKRSIVVSMSIAGLLSGLAGVVFYAGYSLNMQIGIMPSQGFDGIAVALLGASNPIGVILSSIFLGLLHSGKGFMSAMTSVPPEIADTIIAIIIYFTATSLIFKKFFEKLDKRGKKSDV